MYCKGHSQECCYPCYSSLIPVYAKLDKGFACAALATCNLLYEAS